MTQMKIEAAAQLMALAERVRGEYLRDGTGNLDDVVRIERKASAAERAIENGNRPRAEVPDLQTYLAANPGEDAS